MAISRRGPLSLCVVASACIVTSVLPAQAQTGPVPAGSVPGGNITVSDNDQTGTIHEGEQWGRAGGRTITFTVGAPGNLSSLYWGKVFGANPSVAFDNGVDEPGEIMTFAGGGLNTATWQGQAELQFFDGHSEMLPTRFILTTTGPNGPVPLITVAGQVNPGVDAKANPTFTANLKFEAFRGGVWQPLLDLYDGLPTIPGPPPGSPGPVLSSFTSGFFYVGANMTIEEHDANMNTRLNAIKDDTGFLRIDAIGRLMGLGTQVSNNQQQINQRFGELSSQISNLNLGGGNLASKSDIDSAKEMLSTMMLVLWGVMPCPADAGPLCDTATFIKDLATQVNVDALAGKSDLINAAVESLISQSLGIQAGIGGLSNQLSGIDVRLANMEGGLSNPSQSLEVQVVEVSEPSHARRWLLTTTLDGMAVDVDVTRLLGIPAPSKSPTAAQDLTTLMTVRRLTTGLLEVVVNSKAIAFQFDVRHVNADGAFYGSALVGPGKTGGIQ